MATPSVEDIILQITAGWNSNPGEEQIGLRYTGAETCNRFFSIPYKIAADDTDALIDLTDSVYGLASIKWVIIVDTSGVGVKVGKASGAGKFNVRATTGNPNFMVIAESSPFTLYLDNLSADDDTYGQVLVFGSST